MTNNTCYICLDNCEIKSPCSCKSYVHIECFKELERNNQGRKCGYCRKYISINKKKEYYKRNRANYNNSEYTWSNNYQRTNNNMNINISRIIIMSIISWIISLFTSNSNTINMIDINKNNFNELSKIKEIQNNMFHIAEHHYNSDSDLKALYLNKDPIGFVKISYHKKNAYINSLILTKKHNTDNNYKDTIELIKESVKSRNLIMKVTSLYHPRVTLQKRNILVELGFKEINNNFMKYNFDNKKYSIF